MVRRRCSASGTARTVFPVPVEHAPHCGDRSDRGPGRVSCLWIVEVRCGYSHPSMPRSARGVACAARFHLALSSTAVEFPSGPEVPMETAIEVRDLVVERGKRRVLHGLTCAIPRGSVTGLLGPSGSGKTTLMRAIVGVQIVKCGTVTVLGRAGRSHGAAQPDRLPDPGAERVRRPDRAGERPLLRVPLQGSHRRRRRRDRRAMSASPTPPTSSCRHPLRRAARPGVARLRAGQPPRGTDPRRADRRPGPGAARRAVAASSAPWRPPAPRCSSPAT